METSAFAAKYGPWALIAGASEGTGASFAEQLAAQGLNLILIARREGPLLALAEGIRARHGVDCVTASIDLSADAAVDQMAAAAGEREVGLFISNAGADPNGAMFLDSDLANWNALAMRNVMMVMGACHRFGRPMRVRRRGGIILVGSAACYCGVAGISVYGATKAFDLLFGEGLWAELRPYGVDVLNLVMIQTDTPAHRELMQARGMPIPEHMASADDVAALGLARLPHGPVANWSLADDDPGYALISAAARRERSLALSALSQTYARQSEDQPG